MHGICILDRLLLGRGKRLKRLATELLLSEGIPDLIVGLDEFVLDIDVLLVAGLDLVLDRDGITRGDDGTLTQPFDLTTLKLREEGLVLGVRNELDSVVLQLIQLDGMSWSTPDASLREITISSARLTKSRMMLRSLISISCCFCCFGAIGGRRLFRPLSVSIEVVIKKKISNIKAISAEDDPLMPGVFLFVAIMLFCSIVTDYNRYFPRTLLDTPPQMTAPRVTTKRT